jgi:hypothetical protein
MTNVYAFRGRRRRDPFAKLYVPAILLLVFALAPHVIDEPASDQPAAKAKPAPYIRLQSRAEREGTYEPAARDTDSDSSWDRGNSPYRNCTQARAAGHEEIPAGSPLYGAHMDGDLDGVACERVKPTRR